MENYFDITMTDDQLRTISSIGLAHMGDAVFEILVRTWLCAHGKGGAYSAPFDRGRSGGIPPGPQRPGPFGAAPRQPGPVRRGHGAGSIVWLAVAEGPEGPDQ